MQAVGTELCGAQRNAEQRGVAGPDRRSAPLCDSVILLSYRDLAVSGSVSGRGNMRKLAAFVEVNKNLLFVGKSLLRLTLKKAPVLWGSVFITVFEEQDIVITKNLHIDFSPFLFLGLNFWEKKFMFLS